ncbi:unnamed protein product [Linum trigynum]
MPGASRRKAASRQLGSERRTSAARRRSKRGAIDLLGKLPDQLAVEILSRVGMTLKEAARCSILSKGWRNIWQYINDGALEFDGDKLRKTTINERRQFANGVDQALSSHQACLSALRIKLNMLGMDEQAWRWIQLGLAKRVKRLTLEYSCFPCSPNKRLGVSLPLFNPAFLIKQDLTRLEALELEGLSEIPKGTLEHIFSDHCPALKRFALHNSYFGYHGSTTTTTTTKAVISIRCSSIQSLSFRFPHGAYDLSRIELISAPHLRYFELNAEIETLTVSFGGDENLPRLLELRLSGSWLRTAKPRYLLPSQHSRLVLQANDFLPRLVLPRQWQPSTIIALDLHIPAVNGLPSWLDCAIVLRAAPKLRHLCIWFENTFGPKQWERRGGLLSTWKHHSLQALHLYGVHPGDMEGRVDPRALQLELAAHIIMNSPSLTHVLIDTESVPNRSYRLPQQAELDCLYAKYELEAQLLHPDYSASHIHFTYQ